MKILLFSDNPVVTKLVTLSAQKTGDEVSVITALSDVKPGDYSLFIVDDGIYDANVVSEIQSTFNISKSMFMAVRSAEIPSGFELTQYKPFLPTDLVEIFTKVSSEKPEDEIEEDLDIDAITDELELEDDDVTLDEDELILETPTEEAEEESIDEVDLNLDADEDFELEELDSIDDESESILDENDVQEVKTLLEDAESEIEEETVSLNENSIDEVAAALDELEEMDIDESLDLEDEDLDVDGLLEEEATKEAGEEESDKAEIDLDALLEDVEFSEDEDDDTGIEEDLSVIEPESIALDEESPAILEENEEALDLDAVAEEESNALEALNKRIEAAKLDDVEVSSDEETRELGVDDALETAEDSLELNESEETPALEETPTPTEVELENDSVTAEEALEEEVADEETLDDDVLLLDESDTDTLEDDSLLLIDEDENCTETVSELDDLDDATNELNNEELINEPDEAVEEGIDDDAFEAILNEETIANADTTEESSEESISDKELDTLLDEVESEVLAADSFEEPVSEDDVEALLDEAELQEDEDVEQETDALVNDVPESEEAEVDTENVLDEAIKEALEDNATPEVLEVEEEVVSEDEIGAEEIVDEADDLEGLEDKIQAAMGDLSEEDLEEEVDDALLLDMLEDESAHEAVEEVDETADDDMFAGLDSFDMKVALGEAEPLAEATGLLEKDEEDEQLQIGENEFTSLGQEALEEAISQESEADNNLDELNTFVDDTVSVDASSQSGVEALENLVKILQDKKIAASLKGNSININISFGEQD